MLELGLSGSVVLQQWASLPRSWPHIGPSRRCLRTGRLARRRAFLTGVASEGLRLTPGTLVGMARYLGHGRRKGFASTLLRSRSDLEPLADEHAGAAEGSGTALCKGGTIYASCPPCGPA